MDEEKVKRIAAKLASGMSRREIADSEGFNSYNTFLLEIERAGLVMSNGLFVRATGEPVKFEAKPLVGARR